MRKLRSTIGVVIGVALLTFIIYIPKTEAALAFDVASEKNGLADDFTWDHTVATGSDLGLFVCVHVIDFTEADTVVNGVTFDSVTMTNYSDVLRFSGINYYRVSLWYLANPATGTKTISVDIAGTVTDTGGGAVSFSGVNQATPLEAKTEATGDATTTSIDVTTLTDGAWVFDCVTLEVQTADAVGADQTQRWNTDLGSMGMAGSTEGPKSPAGAVTMSWTLDEFLDRQFSHTGVAIKPTAAAAASTDQFTPRIMWFTFKPEPFFSFV